jgi:hypothetical protein
MVWIIFQNSRIAMLFREKINHYYTRDIEEEWTP